MKAKRTCVLMISVILVLTLSSVAQTPTQPEIKKLGNLKVILVQVPRAIEVRMAKKRQFNLDLKQARLDHGRETSQFIELGEGFSAP